MEIPLPRQPVYEPREDAIQKTMDWFKNQSISDKKAFLDNFLHVEEPSHISAYRLCAVANAFPAQFLRGKEQEQVLASSEVTLSDNSDGRGYTETGLRLRETLLLFVKFNQKILYEKAAKNLDLPK